MLSEAKHLCIGLPSVQKKGPEILRFAQNDKSPQRITETINGMMGECDSSIATIDGSDTVYDASIGKLRSRVFVAVGLGGTAFRATNTGGRSKYE